MSNRFREALESGEFVVTCELIPGRGANEPAQQKEYDAAVSIYNTGRVHAISITDNPGGNPAIAADAFAGELEEQGIPTLVHFTCKDKSRNQMQAQLYSMQRRGLQNVLVMTGDYIYSGWEGRSRPVFDLDPVTATQMINDMNQGLVVKGPRGESREEPADFFPGACVSPFKWTEAETVTQYLKMEKKMLAGANFIISQLGYDARKMEELMIYVREKGYDVPMIANVYIISAGTARFMKGGNIPGGYMSDEFLEILTEEAKAEDKGKAARLLRAAKMVAISRGLGYAGVHIGGLNLTAEMFNEILDTADRVQDRWREWVEEIHYGQEDGFYLYEPELDADGKKTGFNTTNPAPKNDSYEGKKHLMKGYGLSRFFHHLMLTKNKGLYGMLKGRMEGLDKKKGVNREHGLEHTGKAMIYGCMDCGDCGLEATVYTCPMTGCPKSQRNGPCGGSADGWCEVYPNERYCIHVKAYLRLKKYNELEKLDSFITPPNNWDYYHTSAWSNYTHDRDNCANRQYLPAPDRRPQAARDKRTGKVDEKKES
ncbi:MAG TPA: methylenetetrahydrofolate reductase [Coriobacteriia bacterium]|nr:methylenetetrahydrofolate reductase [Coriobacteriia bacterium]